MRIRLLAAAAIVLALAGCTSTPDTPAPVPTTTTSAPALLNEQLVPATLSALTTEAASAEAYRLADALQAQLGDTAVSAVDEAQSFPSADDLPPYFGLQRIVTIDPADDNVTVTQTIIAVITKSGWTLYDSTNEDGVYLAALSGGPVDTPWFLVVEGKVVDAVSSVSFTIASPDLVE